MKKITSIFLIVVLAAIIIKTTSMDDAKVSGHVQEAGLLSFGKDLTSTNNINTIIKASPNGECFDELMSVWFEQFDLMQQQGFSMAEADRRAAQVAVNSFKFCAGLNRK